MVGIGTSSLEAFPVGAWTPLSLSLAANVGLKTHMLWLPAWCEESTGWIIAS
jgi:hypothetical protein